MSFKLKVAVGLSGGVDSTVTALLLKQKGFDLIGVYMNNWIDDNSITVCSNDQNRDSAQFVCNKLDIEFKETNFVKTYWNSVFSYLLKGYLSGETPNPDIMCNKFIKFGSFLNYCLETLKVDAIATGHYAGSSYGNFWHNYNNEIPVRLLRPKDKTKDQTFFLSQINQKSLKKVMFPLQHLIKSEVKYIAKQNGFEKIAQKPESKGICFIGKRNFKQFIGQYIKAIPGKFVDIDTGVVVGSHNGIHYWTLGERCRIGGMKTKYFVVHKNLKTNDILVASNTNHSSLYSNRLVTKEFYWISCPPKQLSEGKVFECEFKFQHIDQPEGCRVFPLNDNRLEIELFEPKRALTEGQFAVLYKDDECLGSAPIESFWSSTDPKSMDEVMPNFSNFYSK